MAVTTARLSPCVNDRKEERARIDRKKVPELASVPDFHEHRTKRAARVAGGSLTISFAILQWPRRPGEIALDPETTVTVDDFESVEGEVVVFAFEDDYDTEEHAEDGIEL